MTFTAPEMTYAAAEMTYTIKIIIRNAGLWALRIRVNTMMMITVSCGFRSLTLCSLCYRWMLAPAMSHSPG